jgi:3-dehydroquinate dehydratase
MIENFFFFSRSLVSISTSDNLSCTPRADSNGGLAVLRKRANDYVLEISRQLQTTHQSALNISNSKMSDRELFDHLDRTLAIIASAHKLTLEKSSEMNTRFTAALQLSPELASNTAISISHDNSNATVALCGATERIAQMKTDIILKR